MNIKGLTRDPARVHANLRELPDERLITTKECRIYIPVRFSERGLASVSVETYIAGVYALVMENAYYAVSNVMAMVRIDPAATNKVVINGDEYFEFYFPAGSTLITNLQLVQQNQFVYKVYSEFFDKGRIPWYLGYEDLGRIFDTAKHHAGVNIGQNREVTELLVAAISRDSLDRTKYYRQGVESLNDLVVNPPAFIQLRSVAYAATNTTNKLAGSYMQDGVISALVNPSERTERIEEILRR